MPEPTLTWFELYPPREMTLPSATAVIRVLAGRPRRGLRRTQPVVAFEVWLSRSSVRWLVGCEADLARHLPGELSAQLPGLSVAAVLDSPRHQPISARELRTSSVGQPLRMDTAAAVAAGLLGVRHRLGAEEKAVVQVVVGSSQRLTRQPTAVTPLERLGVKQQRSPDAGERSAFKDKIAEPLFGVRIRAGAVTNDRKRAAQITGPLVSALSLAGSQHARLAASSQSSHTAKQLFRVVGRVRTWSSLVNASELAILNAWPIDGVAIPGRVHDLAAAPRSLLVPANKPEQARGDRLIGFGLHQRDNGALVRLPVRTATSHIHLIAPTGAGKSTLIANWLRADMEAGRSVFLLEPKNDLVADVLALVPAHRRDDVVVIEPGDHVRPVTGLNPLAGSRADAERRADSLLHLFKSVFGSAIGPRSSDVLLHALIMAARLEDGSLTDVPAILTNDGFRRRVLAKVTDPLIIAPWAAGFDSLSEQERSRVVMPVLNKTRALVNRAAIRRMLGQAKLQFSLDELFSSPKIVLVSLNAGIIGPETAKLLGSIILNQFWEAVQRQASVPQAERRPVMAVIDELADFTAGLDFAALMAKARGMAVSVTAAHQHLRQLSPNLRAALLANARSRICWRPAKDDSKALADVLGVSTDTLMRLPAYHAVAQVLVDNTPSTPFAVKTLPLPAPTSDPDALRKTSAERYGVDPVQLDAQLLERWQGSQAPPDGPVGLTRRRPQG